MENAWNWKVTKPTGDIPFFHQLPGAKPQVIAKLILGDLRVCLLFFWFCFKKATKTGQNTGESLVNIFFLLLYYFGFSKLQGISRFVMWDMKDAVSIFASRSWQQIVDWNFSCLAHFGSCCFISPQGRQVGVYIYILITHTGTHRHICTHTTVFIRVHNIYIDIQENTYYMYIHIYLKFLCIEAVTGSHDHTK